MSGVDTNPTGSVWLVARRELRALHGRTFAVSAVVLCVTLAAYLALQAQLGASEPPRVGLSGQATSLAGQLEADVARLGGAVEVSDVANLADGRAQVASGSLDALVSGTPSALRVTARDPLDGSLRAAVTGLARRQALDGQLAEAGLTPARVHARMLATDVRVDLLRATDPDRDARFGLGVGFAAALFLSLVAYGSRIADPRPGTALGAGLLALVQVAGLGVVGVLLAAAFGLLGLSWAVLGTLLAGLGWFALGFPLYAGLLRLAPWSAPGAAPGSALAAAGVLHILGMSVLFQAPDSELSDALSLLPPFAPVLLPARIGLGDTSVWQLALSLVLTLGALGWLARRESYVRPG